MKIIHFPAFSGLSPRPACQYDLDCRSYALAIRSGNRKRAKEIESSIGGNSDDLDHAYSQGKNLLKCKIENS